MVFDGDLRVPAGFKLVTPQIDALSSTIDVNAVQVNANTELQVTEGNLLFVDNIQAVGSSGVDIDYINPVIIYSNPVADDTLISGVYTPTANISVGSDFSLPAWTFRIPTTTAVGSIIFSAIQGCRYELISGSSAVRSFSFTTSVTCNMGSIGSSTFITGLGGEVYNLFFPTVGSAVIPIGTNTITIEFSAVWQGGSSAAAVYGPTARPLYDIRYRDIITNYRLNR